MSERQYWIPECICEWNQFKEMGWNPLDDLTEFPDVQEKLSFISPSEVDTRLVRILDEAKHLFEEYQKHLKVHFTLDDQRKQWIKKENRAGSGTPCSPSSCQACRVSNEA